MLNHLPILQVIVPLLAAPACIILNRPRAAWIFACLAALLTFLVSTQLLSQVYDNGTLSYMLGGWEAPWGIEYRIDLLSAYMLLIVSALGVIVLLAAWQSVARELAEDKQPVFYVLYLLCLAGLLGIVATGDIFNVFVFLEISSLSSYALIALGRERRALWAAYQYLIVGTLGATFFLIGIGFLYSLTGTLNMQDVTDHLAGNTTHTVYTAYGFIVVGICLKLALFPLHFWLPNAYAYAPSIVTAFLAATATKVAVYLLLRMTYSIFGASFTDGVVPIGTMLIVLGLVGVFAASLVAIKQANIKRLFAYSSVAQIGYMMIGIGIGTAAAVQATLLHLFNHALMKSAIFLALAAVMYRVGDVQRNNFSGLAKQMPWTMAAMVVGGLSLVGVPLTVGFVSKWYLVLAAIEAGMWPLALLVVAGSILAVYYLWSLVETAYFGQPAATSDSSSTGRSMEAPLSLLLPMWVLAMANIYFGIDTQLPVSISNLAADLLVGGAQ